MCRLAGDTRPAFDAESIKCSLREAHPQIFQALEQAREGSTILHSSVPACVAAVSILKQSTQLSLSNTPGTALPAC